MLKRLNPHHSLQKALSLSFMRSVLLYEVTDKFLNRSADKVKIFTKSTKGSRSIPGRKIPMDG
jgi:hypothetical protein